MALYAELFDGTRLEFPDNTDPAVIDRVAREETAKRQPKGESGFLPAVKASTQSLLGEAALLGGKLGILSPEEAQKKFEAREAEARRIFAPTESWSDGAFTKFKELLGGSIPYVVAPLAAAGAAAAAPLTGTAAVAAGLGAAGLTSAAQFTGSNLARQLETGKSLDEASFGAAAAAAAPQALLDIVAFRAAPLIRQLFTSVGKDITEEAAQNLAKQGIANTIKDYAVTTGKTAGVEGLTESGQSFLERLQAGLNIADPSARAEYLDSFIGGAVLGGTLAPVGRYVERQKQVEEPLAPGQRPGESLEQTAQRLNFDIKQMTAPPEKSPFLSSSELASMAAEENGYGKLVQYAESIKQEPDSPEKQASLEAAIELRKKVVSEAEARQTPTDKPYPFAEEPEKPIYLTGTGLIDLVNTKETPKDQLVSLLEYISKTKKDPESPERDQSIEQARTLYNLLQEEAKSRGFELPEPFTLRATDLRAAGIPRTDPVYDQVKDKDLNNPDEADFVVKALEEAQKRATPDLYDKLEGVLDSIDRYLESRPGSGFYAQRTYPKPSGEGVEVAGRRAGEQPSAEGLAPSERGGVAPVTEPAEQPVPTEKVQPAPLAVKPVQPDFSNMSLEELEKAREDADKNNLQLDLAAIRKYLGEDAAKKYEGLSRRARESWWDKNATTELENESSVFRGVDEALIDEYIQAFNNFDTTSPKDLGRSIALLVRDIDKPNFIGSPSYVTLRNAVTYAKQQGWKEEEVTGAMRQRASEWAGADAKELFKNLFAEAKKPAEKGEKLAAEPKKLTGKKSLAKVAPQVSEAKFKELEAKAAKPSEAKPPEEKVRAPELQEKIDQLQGVLNKILAKYGLKDVKVNLEEGMADEGSYSGQLIKLALDLDNPVRTLRHEAIHALKELGFFTPQQWKVLTDRANKEWIDRYLKSQKAVVDGKEMTRYDAYMQLYDGDMEAIVEESIADAFADFTKAPPPAGMMKAILNRMQNLFKAIKQAMKVGGYDTAEDVFGAVEKGELPAPPITSVPESADIRKSLRPLPTLPTDVTDRIKATIVPRYQAGYIEKTLEAISPKQFSKFRKEFINRYDALARFDREAAKQIKLMGGKEQLADAKAESAALFADLGGGLAASAMGVNDRKGGIPVYVKKYVVEKDFLELSTHNTKAAADAAAKKVPGAKVYEQGYTKVMDKAEGLLPIFQQLAAYAKPKLGEPDAYSQYQFWADVKRTSKYILNPGTGKYEEKLFTQDDINRAKAIEEAFPEFVEIQKKWIAYNNGLVDFMRDTGVISEAGAKEMKKHGDYFPLYRHLGEDDIQGPRLFTSIANVQGPKAAKGSESEVTDFFETIVRNTQSAIQAGIKNVAARRATDQAIRIGEVVKLDRPQSGPTVYRVLEDGKETYYQARDPMFIESLKSLYQPDIPFIGLLSAPARILRNLVTKDPAFQLANMMRDSLSAYVASGFKFTPIVATLKQYAKAIADKSPEMRELRSAGVIGGYDYSQGVETSARKLEAEIRKAAKARTTMEKLTSPATTLWGALEKSSEASDSATRQEVYKKVLEQTGNEAEALYQALEIMNFNRKGRSPIIRILTAAVPFMNARIQGLDVLYRSGMRPISGDATEAEKKRMNTFWVRGMMLMALSSMYWLLTHDDEEYKAQEQETRDNYWLFPSAGVKIPIPFEIGVMFKVIPERILEYAFGSDTGKDFLKSMSRQFMSTFAFNPIPQTFLPAVEVTTNYSFFTQRPIISPGMENISPEYQVGPNTSKVAGAIGQALNISPIKLDYLIQGYTGTMGMYAVNLFDSFFSMNDEAPKPSKRLEQMPVLKRFMVDPEARGSISAYYDLKNSVDEVVRTSNFLQRSMDFESYGQYMQENVQMLAVKDYINDLEKTMKEYREMKNLVRISNMDADSKRDTLSNIGKLEQQLTKNIQMLKKQIASQS